MKVPYVAFGNEELRGQPVLGGTITCWRCGELHPVRGGMTIEKDGTRTPSNTLQFMTCGEKTYLCGINGSALPPPKT